MEEDWEAESEAIAERQRRVAFCTQFKRLIGEQWEYFEFCNMKHWPIWSSVMGRIIGYVGYKVEVKIREKAFEKAWRKNFTTIPSYTEEETEKN